MSGKPRGCCDIEYAALRLKRYVLPHRAGFVGVAAATLRDILLPVVEHRRGKKYVDAINIGKMLTLKVLREESARVVERLKVKGFDATEAVKRIAELDDARKALQQRSDAVNAELNNIAKEVGMLFKEGRADEANRAKERTVTLKEEARALEEKLKQT